MNQRIFTLGLIFISMFLILISCNKNSIYEDQLSLEDQIWNQDQKAVFEFDIDNTEEYYDFFINIRNTEDYPYSNIYLFTTLYFPNNKIAVDTFQCILADQQGRWIGSGVGGLHENRIRFARNKALPLTGKYKIEINQAMREEALEGVSDVGFAIEIHQD